MLIENGQCIGKDTNDQKKRNLEFITSDGWNPNFS